MNEGKKGKMKERKKNFFLYLTDGNFHFFSLRHLKKSANFSHLNMKDGYRLPTFILSRISFLFMVFLLFFAPTRSTIFFVISCHQHQTFYFNICRNICRSTSAKLKILL
jgi:hypothetical protein